MKSLKLSQNKVTNLDPIPMILIIGRNEQYKSKLFNILLSDEDFYSQKYGRIIYIGERRYKSEKICLDEENWREFASYEEIIDLLDDAKAENIINLLIVINTKNIDAYTETIDKLMGLRLTYLPGIISLMVNVVEVTSLRRDLYSSFNTQFCFESEKMEEIISLFKIKKELEAKRKKDVYIFGLGKVEIYKEIRD